MLKGAKHCWTLFVLVISGILGLFVNALTANDKYSLPNSKNLPQPLQMELSKEEKFSSQFFAQFLKFTSEFEYFEKKMTLIADIFPKLKIAKDVVREISEKPRFKNPYGSQHAKGAQILPKSAWQHFYHICW